MAVYDYAKQVEAKQGLVIMDTPGNDPSSVAAMVAGGAQIVVFSTGRGTPTGNPLAPVIKITGNKLTYANMIDNIDVDASPLIYGTKTIEELGQASSNRSATVSLLNNPIPGSRNKIRINKYFPPCFIS